MAGLEVVGAAGKEELAGSIGGGNAALRNDARRVAVDEWGLAIEKSRGLERRSEDERQGASRSRRQTDSAARGKSRSKRSKS